jgi:glycosyltransferase involved in cell wall biosynthesis
MITISEKTKSHAIEAETSWGSAYGLIGKVIQDRNLMIGAEIGVAFGGHSESILKVPSVTKLYGVDPYQHDPNYIDAMNLPQEEFDELYQFTTSRLSKFGDRYQHIRKPSQQAVNEISGTLDFVYIDADHSYNGVWKDLCTWFGKVRDEGIIGGHDYDHPDIPGVKQAVDDFFRRFGWEIHTEGATVWWVEKKGLNISFIMPAYNCEKTIAESIESIFDGNFEKGDEIVITNDGSTDNTKNILDDLVKKYPEIKIVEHKQNKGGGAARNTAIENTSYPIIFCLDSDNLLETGNIGRLKKYLADSGADIVAFQEVRYFNTADHAKVHHKWIYKDEDIYLSDYLAGPRSPGSSGNYMFTKGSWVRAGGYPEFCFMDTWGFGFRQLATGSKMAIMPESYYYHRIGHDSYWVRESTKQNLSLIVLQIMIPFLGKINDQDVDYIMGRKGRYSWFDHLEERPLRIKGLPIGATGREEYAEDSELKPSDPSSLSKIKTKMYRVLHFIKKYLG